MFFIYYFFRLGSNGDPNIIRRTIYILTSGSSFTFILFPSVLCLLCHQFQKVWHLSIYYKRLKPLSGLMFVLFISPLVRILFSFWFDDLVFRYLCYNFNRSLFSMYYVSFCRYLPSWLLSSCRNHKFFILYFCVLKIEIFHKTSFHFFEGLFIFVTCTRRVLFMIFYTLSISLYFFFSILYVCGVDSFDYIDTIILLPSGIPLNITVSIFTH